jgi:hypothetical protein
MWLLIGSTATPSLLIEGARSRSGHSGGGGDFSGGRRRRRSPAVVETWVEVDDAGWTRSNTASDQLLLLLHLLALSKVVTVYC